jgi:hypothetical protein
MATKYVCLAPQRKADANLRRFGRELLDQATDGEPATVAPNGAWRMRTCPRRGIVARYRRQERGGIVVDVDRWGARTLGEWLCASLCKLCRARAPVSSRRGLAIRILEENASQELARNGARSAASVAQSRSAAWFAVFVSSGPCLDGSATGLASRCCARCAAHRGSHPISANIETGIQAIPIRFDDRLLISVSSAYSAPCSSPVGAGLFHGRF